MAGVPRVSAISDDYPGSLLDVRHRVPDGLPEPERALSLAVAAGFALPDGDDLRLRVRTDRLPATGRARRPRLSGAAPRFGGAEPGLPPELAARIVRALTAAGHRVAVTGGPDEGALTARVAGDTGIDLGGRTGLADLAGVLAGAGALVVGNTGPAHLAAALGTPVVSLFAPTVPYGQWGPYRVPTVRLGDAAAPCRDTRATVCPVPGHPCLAAVGAGRASVAAALPGLLGSSPASAGGAVAAR